MILGYGCEIFSSYNKDKIEFRNKLYADLAFITNKANKKYFPRPK